MRTLLMVVALVVALVAPATVEARGTQHPIICGTWAFGTSPRTGLPNLVYVCKRF